MHAQLFSTSMQMLSRSPDFQTNQRAIRPRYRSRTNRIEVSSIVFISMFESLFFFFWISIFFLLNLYFFLLSLYFFSFESLFFSFESLFFFFWISIFFLLNLYFFLLNLYFFSFESLFFSFESLFFQITCLFFLSLVSVFSTRASFELKILR